MTPEERSLIKALTLVWPRGLGHEVDSEGDRQWREVGGRLIEVAVIERNQSETVGLVEYRLADDFVAEIGGTSRPEDN